MDADAVAAVVVGCFVGGGDGDGDGGVGGAEIVTRETLGAASAV